MENEKLHYRHILLFLYRKGLNASKAYREICDVYGEDALSERVCQKWFSRFKNGQYSLNDAPRSGRPNEVNPEEIKALIEKDPRHTVREIAADLNISHTTVENHLKALGYVQNMETKQKEFVGVPKEKKIKYEKNNSPISLTYK